MTNAPGPARKQSSPAYNVAKQGVEASNYDTESRTSTPTTDEDYGLFNHCAERHGCRELTCDIDRRRAGIDVEHVEVKVNSQSVELSHTESSTAELIVGNGAQLAKPIHLSGGP